VTATTSSTRVNAAPLAGVELPTRGGSLRIMGNEAPRGARGARPIACSWVRASAPPAAGWQRGSRNQRLTTRGCARNRAVCLGQTANRGTVWQSGRRRQRASEARSGCCAGHRRPDWPSRRPPSLDASFLRSRMIALRAEALDDDPRARCNSRDNRLLASRTGQGDNLPPDPRAVRAGRSKS
jgi:hypothetical protein